MAKFYTISPEGIPPNPVLFPTFVNQFLKEGHTFTYVVSEADVFLLDLHTRISDYSETILYKVKESGKPIVTFDEWDRGCMSSDEWPNPLTRQQQDIFQHIQSGIKTSHFCRLLDKTKFLPPYLYPYEKPILYEEPFCTPDDLFNREYDICYIANSAPNRDAIAQGLVNYGKLRCHIALGQKKLEFPEFLQWHKRAKLFINSSAGGYTCERPQLLFSVAGMIRQNTNQLLLHDFTDLVNCIRISSPPKREELDIIYNIVNQKYQLHDLYSRTYSFIKEYYSKDYIAAYILNVLKQNEII